MGSLSKEQKSTYTYPISSHIFFVSKMGNVNCTTTEIIKKLLENPKQDSRIHVVQSVNDDINQLKNISKESVPKVNEKKSPDSKTTQQDLTKDENTTKIQSLNLLPSKLGLQTSPCLADGGTPNRADISIVNNTAYELALNTEENCGHECNHEGWKILDGKIVKGNEPPEIIPPYTTVQFSVSGRKDTAVAPKGRVFYLNARKNLKVVFDWNASGLVSMANSTASISINGIAQKKGVFGKDPKPWNKKLIGVANPESWIFNLSEVEGIVKESKKVSTNANEDLNDFTRAILILGLPKPLKLF